MTCLSMSAHACARLSSPTTVSALSMALLIAGTSSCGQFELFVGTMFFPLKVGSSIVCGSAKSLSQPVLGQIGVFDFGMPQYFEYIVSRVTGRKFTENPRFFNEFRATVAAAFWLVELSATIVMAGPLNFPFEKPAFFRYCAASAGSPSGFLR